MKYANKSLEKIFRDTEVPSFKDEEIVFFPSINKRKTPHLGSESIIYQIKPVPYKKVENWFTIALPESEKERLFRNKRQYL